MKYYRLYTQDSKSIIVAEQPDGTFINLTSANPELCSLNQLALSSSIMDITIDDLVNKVITSSNVSQIEFDTTRKSSSNYQIGIPFNPPEVWASQSRSLSCFLRSVSQVTCGSAEIKLRLVPSGAIPFSKNSRHPSKTGTA